MIDFMENLQALNLEALMQVQTIFVVLSCIVIVCYWIGIYYLENTTNATLWSQVASTHAEPQSKKKWIAKSTLRKPQTANTNTVQIPKVALKYTTVNIVQGYDDMRQLLVFNTTHSEDFIPGYYYWDGDEWICLKAVDNNSTNCDNTNEEMHSITLQDIPEEVIDKVGIFSQDFEKWAGLPERSNTIFDRRLAEEHSEMAYFEPVKDSSISK